MTEKVGLLDTSVIIDFTELSASALPGIGLMSAVSLAELSTGPSSAKNSSERLKRVRQILLASDEFEVLPFHKEEARQYARLFEKLHSMGTKARGGRSLDLMIAATALAHQLPLYTRNPKDFAAVNDIVNVVAV